MVTTFVHHLFGSQTASCPVMGAHTSARTAEEGNTEEADGIVAR